MTPVEVSSDRRFRFDVAPPALWAALAATGEYRAWWPWLRGFDARGLLAGDVWRCVVQPPLPYRLRFAVELGDVVPERLVTATVSGDIAGTARLSIAPDVAGSEVRLESVLAPASRSFAVLAMVLRPLAKRGHDWVLDTGAAQFAARAGNGAAGVR